MAGIGTKTAGLNVLTEDVPCVGDGKQPCSYGAALIATLIFLPVAATLFTLILILLSSEQTALSKHIPLWGALCAFAAWIVSGLLFRRIADARHAIPSSYGELLPRLNELETDLEHSCPAAASTENPCTNTAYYEAVTENCEIRRDLAAKGLNWPLATGYVKVWEELYRAEEAMIEVAPQKKVLEGAFYDEERLVGSDIPNRQNLLDKLRKAVASIDPGAYKYLSSTTADTPPPVLSIGTTALPGAAL